MINLDLSFLSPTPLLFSKHTHTHTHKIAGSPIFGWLGDKIKQRRIPMLLGISASIAANLMFMFAFAYWMLLLARFLQGVSNAAVWTMSLCLIADNWPENQLGKVIHALSSSFFGCEFTFNTLSLFQGFKWASWLDFIRSA